MAIVKWSDDFKIGDVATDKEHRGLFALIHDLSDKLALGAGERSVKVTIEALVTYVDVHFENEERIMENSGYPGFKAHKQVHEKLSRQVNAFQHALERAPEDFQYYELMEFLSNWLKQHIVNLDMEFASYYKEQTVQA